MSKSLYMQSNVKYLTEKKKERKTILHWSCLPPSSKLPKALTSMSWPPDLRLSMPQAGGQHLLQQPASSAPQQVASPPRAAPRRGSRPTHAVSEARLSLIMSVYPRPPYEGRLLHRGPSPGRGPLTTHNYISLLQAFAHFNLYINSYI